MNNSAPLASFASPTAPTANPLRLELLGPIPSFKNRKRIAGHRLITRPDVKKRMEEITDSLAWQLLSAFQTAAAATSTAPSLPYWIAWSIPADDCWTNIPDIYIRAELCPPGREGATLTILPL